MTFYFHEPFQKLVSLGCYVKNYNLLRTVNRTQ